MATYEKAAKFAKTHLGEEHSLTQNLENVLKNAQDGKFNLERKGERRRMENKEKVENMRKTYNKDQRPHTGFKSMKKVWWVIVIFYVGTFIRSVCNINMKKITVTNIKCIESLSKNS